VLYPNLAGQFGSKITPQGQGVVSSASQTAVALDEKGIFYEQSTKAYIMHLSGDGARFDLTGEALTANMERESLNTATLVLGALYQVCVHLGCKVPSATTASAQVPCHGSHYNMDGRVSGRSAPRSLDRLPCHLKAASVVVDTGKLNQHIQRPDPHAYLAVPGVQCAALDGGRRGHLWADEDRGRWERIAGIHWWLSPAWRWEFFRLAGLHRRAAGRIGFGLAAICL